MRHVLILCTGSSCRSIMGEVLLRDLGSGRLVAHSAGSKPAGAVNPLALALLKAKGHDVSGLRSKSWDEFAATAAPKMDYVFTVCGSAASEQCPVWIGVPLQAHWGIDDPYDVTGATAEIAAACELAYRKLRRRIEAFLTLPLETRSTADLKNSITMIGQRDD